MAALGELDGERADDVAEASSLGPGGNLGGDEDDLHGAVSLGGVGRAGLLGDGEEGVREIRIKLMIERCFEWLSRVGKIWAHA